MVPVLFDVLTSHAKQVARDDVSALIGTLFRLADELRIPGDEDRGFPSADAHLRLHWLIRRLTDDRFDIDQRTELYLQATENAPLEWLVDFVSSAVGDYKEKKDGPQPEERCLTNAEALPALKARAIAALTKAAEDGTLLLSGSLIYLVYRWRDFSGDDGAEMRAWLASHMQHDDVLVVLAKALTGESWSTGMGIHGLGDRVSRRHVMAQIRDDMDLFDQQQFRANLERIVAEKQRPPDDITAVEIFLDAWKKRNSADD